MRPSYTQARLALVTALGWAAFACSSGDVTPPAVALSDLPDRYAQVLCDGVKPCCQAAGLAYDSAACASAANDAITVALGILASRQDTVYDSIAAALCLSELQSALRECSVDRAPACANLFTGTQAPGAACTTDSQCAGADAYCSDAGACARPELSACQKDAAQCAARDPDAASAERCGGSP